MLPTFGHALSLAAHNARQALLLLVKTLSSDFPGNRLARILFDVVFDCLDELERPAFQSVILLNNAF
jgi:hypothetical protein